MSKNVTLLRIQQEIQESIEREEQLRRDYAKKSQISPKNQNSDNLTNGNVVVNSVVPRVNQLKKGVMQKFFKMHTLHNNTNLIHTRNYHRNGITPNFCSYEPTVTTVKIPANGRNGYVSAEEKMRKELQEFQERETELRLERQKSQQFECLELEQSPIESFKIKKTQSLGDLCDDRGANLEELPKTLQLIRQFEDLKNGKS